MRISDWSSDVCSSDLSSASSAAGASSAATSEGGVASSNSSSLSGSSAVATASACSSSNIAAMTSMPWLCISASSGERATLRPEEHTSELQSLMRISYAVFCLKKKKQNKKDTSNT